MRTLTTLLTGTLLLASTATHATIRRVNANPALSLTPPGAPVVYTTLAQAVGASNLGDTIHIEPGTYTYGATIDRRLVIIGNGYLLGAGQNENLQFNTSTSRISGITLAAGAAGSHITGLNFYSGGLTINANDVTVDRNYFNGENISIGASVSNITITRNKLNSITQPSANQTVSNVLIKNNYFSGRIVFDDTGDQFSGIVVLNNTFNSTGAHVFTSGVFGVFAYNILYQGTLNASNMDTHHNIAVSGTGLPAGNNNTNGLPLSSQFPASGSDDGRWDLTPTSEYRNYDGHHLGMYGGTKPYIRSGIPVIPTIYYLGSTPILVGWVDSAHAYRAVL